MAAAGPSRPAIYATHLRSDLVPAVQAAREQLARVRWDLSEYRDVVARLQQLPSVSGPASSGQHLDGHNAGMTTMTELGGGVWVEAWIPDTSTVTLDIGLDLHVDLPIKDAIVYATKRISVLNKRKETLEKRIEGLNWQVEQFHGAIAQAEAGLRDAVR